MQSLHCTCIDRHLNRSICNCIATYVEVSEVCLWSEGIATVWRKSFLCACVYAIQGILSGFHLGISSWGGGGGKLMDHVAIRPWQGEFIIIIIGNIFGEGGGVGSVWGGS